MTGPVLLIHGFTSGPFAFEFLISRLRKEGLEPEVPLLRGHGQDSWRKLAGFTWPDWLDDARAALERTSSRGPVIVVGHSMGGLLALNLAVEHPDLIRKLILAGAAIFPATPFGPGRPLGFLRPMMEKLFRSWDMTPFYTDRSMLRSDLNYRRAPMESISTFMDLVVQTRRRLHRVVSPALVLQGTGDRRVHWRSAGMILDGIATPADRKRAVMFPETDHEMFRDCEREAVIQTVMDCLGDQDRIRT